MATFYHGTAKPFAKTVRENGLVPPPGHGRGVWLTRSAVAARKHARAWAAYVLYEQRAMCEGMIVVCKILDLSRVRVDSRDVIRAEYVLPTEIERLHGPIKFSEFGDPTIDADGPRQPFFDALELWEDLTARRVNVPFPRRRVRRS